MKRKPTEAQILHQEKLESWQQRRDNLKRAILDLATTPEMKAKCDTFVAQLTNNGEVDINDLPVERRLQLTREGIFRLLNPQPSIE